MRAKEGKSRLNLPPIICLTDPVGLEYATRLPNTATLYQRREHSRVLLCLIIRRFSLPLKTCQAREYPKAERFQFQRIPEQDTGRSECDKSEDARSFY